MPIFMVISLVMSTAAVGLVFNYGVSLVRQDDGVALEFGANEVEAQSLDTATTSVTVRNAPPTFDDQAYESPASTSTSPVEKLRWKFVWSSCAFQKHHSVKEKSLTCFGTAPVLRSVTRCTSQVSPSGTK